MVWLWAAFTTKNNWCLITAVALLKVRWFPYVYFQLIKSALAINAILGIKLKITLVGFFHFKFHFYL